MNDLNFTDSYKNLISDFQKLRNQIAHMGTDSIEREFINKVNLLIGPIIGGLSGVFAAIACFGTWYVFNKKSK